MNKPGYLYALLIVVLIYSGCQNPQSVGLCNQGRENDTSGRIFLVGEEVIKSEVLNDIIQASDLDTRGYSLILTSEDIAGSTEISDLVKALKYFKIRANHVISINDSMHISRADEIAIRNAQVIFLAFNSRKMHASFLADSSLTAALKQAFSNAKSIVGIGPGAGLLGEITVTSTIDPQTSETEIKTVAGLNFLPEALVDKDRFFINHQDLVLKFAAENPLLFLGVGSSSFVHYCNQELTLKRPESLLVIKDGKLLDQSEIEGLKKIKLLNNDG